MFNPHTVERWHDAQAAKVAAWNRLAVYLAATAPSARDAYMLASLQNAYYSAAEDAADARSRVRSMMGR
jgi:hypothetical protein